MIKFPSPSEAPMKSDEEQLLCDPKRLAQKYAEIRGQEDVVSVLMQPWHPDPKVEPQRSLRRMSLCSLSDTLGSVDPVVYWSDVMREVVLVHRDSLQNAGWNTHIDPYGDLYVSHPNTTPSANSPRISWWKRIFS